MITLKVRIPAPSSMLLANVLGVLALMGLAVAIGGITHNAWWTLLVASVEALTLAVVWSLRLDADEDEDEGTVSVITRAA